MQYELKIPYRLNNNGQKSCLLSGDDGKPDQEVSGKISQEDLLHSMIVIDHNGYPNINHRLIIVTNHLLSFGEAWKLASTINQDDNHKLVMSGIINQCVILFILIVPITAYLFDKVWGMRIPDKSYYIIPYFIIAIMLFISVKYIVNYFIDKAYRMGAIAREKGKKLNDNPFSKDNRKQGWIDGWIDANISDVRN